MLIDISPPPLSRVIVLGELKFEDQRDYNFTANLVKYSSTKQIYDNITISTTTIRMGLVYVGPVPLQLAV